MEFTLYTLPNCSICHMIKTKLNEKQIKYTEAGLNEIASILNIDHAPVLKISHNEKVDFITSPGEMVKLINNYVE